MTIRVSVTRYKYGRLSDARVYPSSLMASDESLTTMVSSSILNEDYEDTDDGLGLQYQTRHRLSVCTSSIHDYEDEDSEDVTNNPSEVGIFISDLSLETFDGADADGEASDVGGKENGGSSDSDKETGFYSLPATPSRGRRKLTVEGKKEGSKCNIRRHRRGTRESKPSKPSWMVKESDGGEGGGGGLTVITRARGGKKSLRMGLEEVKACKDLGLELEVVPGRVSVSTGSTTFDTQTSSGGNSPVANWPISSPGDDPREVKARLKVWAQAVALASATRHIS